VRRLEVRLFVFAFNGVLPLDWLLGIGNVLRELFKRSVVTDFGGMRRLEGLVVLDGGRLGFRRLARRDRNVFANHSPVAVEEVRLFRLLREWLFLHEGLTLEAFLLCELLWDVVVVSHVWNYAAEGCVLADNPFFGRVHEEVAWADKH